MAEVTPAAPFGGDLAERLPALPGLSAVERALTRPSVWAGAIALLAVLQTWLIVTHAPWLDEWQALQIAVQSPTIHDLFVNLSYEGHPAPWYFLLRGLAAVLPDPLMALPAAALLLAAVAQATILTAAPFSRSERLLLSLSQFVLFEFLTLSRSLTLGATVVLLAAALWRRPRAAWFAIAFLPQCDFLFGVIAVAMVFLRWRERRLWWPGVALFIATGLFAAWTVRPAPDMMPALHALPIANGIGVWLARVATIGVPLQWYGGALAWDATAPALLLPIGGVLFYAVVRNELSAHRDHLVVFLGFVALTFVFSVAVYPLATRHLFMIALLLIALVWMRVASGGAAPGTLFRAWLVVSAACGLASAGISAVMPFDTAASAAKIIRERGLVDKQWFAFRDSRGQGVAAINGMTFQPVGRDCAEDFIRWNFYGDLTAAEVRGQLHDFAQVHGRYYILADVPLEHIAPFAHRFAGIPAGYDGFAFYLYEVGAGRPDAPRTTKRCNGPTRRLR